MTVIQVENLWKQYRLGVVSRGWLTKDIESWWARKRGKEDPHSKINDRRVDGTNGDYIWALKDINLEVKQGEILGIIGKNGAGKSTLLKILTKITKPTSGLAKLRGRVASLLEVGTGFHPELTGRENIYLNGAILGMQKAEIDRKFDEIVDFAGVEKFIDTPVKRYSSGMYVRLAFAVAAHLEPEILLIDEVLAVGDAEFQKKAIGKMQNIASGEGRTVLFVSHNMGSVQKLCTKCIILANGSVNFNGNVEDAVRFYLSENRHDDLSAEKIIEYTPGKDFQLVYAKVCDEAFNGKSSFECDENVYLLLKFKINKKIPGLYGYLSLSKKDSNIAVLISDSNDIVMNFFDRSPVGEVDVRVKIPKRTLGVGVYLVYLNFTSHFSIDSFHVDSPFHILSFTLVDNNTRRGNNRGGYLSTLLEWEFVEQLNNK